MSVPVLFVFRPISHSSPVLFCSALLCRGAALCEAGFSGFHELRYRSTDGRLQSVEKERLEYFSYSLSAPGSEF